MRNIKIKIKTISTAVIILMTAFTSCKSHKNIEKTFPDDIYENYPSQNKALQKEVKEWIGVPYKYGGHSKDGADCSGLVMEVYLKVYNIKLYRNSREIYNKNCKPIEKKELREGDLVFFGKDGVTTINHVGIYLNDNKFVHASSSKGVMINDLNESYYLERYITSGRVINY